MAEPLATIDALLPPGRKAEETIPDFVAAARYYAPMDSVLYLREDVSYRADRIDAFLTLLWHPYEERAVGLKIKGFRFLFERLQAIAAARGGVIPNQLFISLLEAVELAISVELGAVLTDEAEQGRREEAAKRAKKYDKAREIARSIEIDANDLAHVA
jgi:hypothetical protein